MSDSPIVPTNEELVGQPESQAAAPAGASKRAKRNRRLLIVIILILMLAMCGIAAVLIRLIQPSPDEVAGGDDAGGIQWVRSIYGWGPDASQLFVAPRKVEVGDGGTIYVTDAQFPFVMQFTPTGDFTRSIGENADPDLYAVGAVAEGDGQLFFGQTAQDRVRVFTDEGAEESNFPFPSPNDIEYSGDRVAISSNVGFVVFDEDGSVVNQVGGRQGEAEGEFDVIAGVAYGPEGNLYVADSYNNRIIAYDPEGEQLWVARTGNPPKNVDITNMAEASGRETTAPAAMQLPVDLVVDGANRLVAVDGMDFSIVVLDTADGSFIEKYGEYGPKEGQLFYPTSIDYDSERDWFVVADSGNRRVQILRIEGSSSGAGGLLGGIRRAISGPLRACLFPLALLLLIVIVWLVWRRRNRKKQEALAADSQVVTTEITEAGSVPELGETEEVVAESGPDVEPM